MPWRVSRQILLNKRAFELCGVSPGGNVVPPGALNGRLCHVLGYDGLNVEAPSDDDERYASDDDSDSDPFD